MLKSPALLIGAALSLVIASPAFSEPITSGNFFGSVTGMYSPGGLAREWSFEGRPARSWEFEGVGGGGIVNARLGYRFSDWDVALYGQYANLSSGDVSRLGGWDGYLSAAQHTIDLEAGYRLSGARHDTRLFAGLRYAAWNNDVFSPTPARAVTVSHDFEGLGPKAGFQGETGLGSSGYTIEYGAAASLLFGRIRTSSVGDFNCIRCSDYNATAYSLDGEIGVGKRIGKARFVAGVQAQYWGNVNVRFTDTSGNGRNAGTSGHLVAGPFLRIAW